MTSYSDTIAKIKSIPILDITVKLGYTPQKLGNLYNLKEHDSLVIYPHTNSFYRFSTGAGGSVIDLYMELANTSLTESINALKDFNNIPNNYSYQTDKKEIKDSKKEFNMPPTAQGKYSKMYAYLLKTRCIDSSVINDLVKRKLIYQDQRNNVVFCSLDNSNNIVGGILRATNTITSGTSKPFKGQVQGSNLQNGFFVNNSSKILYVTEAPIDTLSIMTFKKAEQKQVNDYSYLALGGNNPQALNNILKNNPNIQKVVLCLDNDPPGHTIKQRLIEHLNDFKHIQIKQVIPQNKDFNDDLVKLKTTNSNQLHHQKDMYL